MFCPKCGKEIPDNSFFCSQCGFDLRNTSSLNFTSSSEEQIPLLIIWKQMLKHKIAFIVSFVIIVIATIGYISIKKYKEKKKNETEYVVSLRHLMSIVGTYQNSDIKLILDTDNRALITINLNSSRERSYRGYWQEKVENLIEINFSDSFEIYIGNKRHSYCSTLYLLNNRIWESRDAIYSRDYYASELLEKK